MHLTPHETDRLLLFSAAELARKRRARGLKLNYPEARALIADEVLEGARDGKSVAEMMEFGATILTTDDVMPGVDVLVGTLQVEGVFPDGQKLVTIHSPIRAGTGQADEMIPGEIVAAEGEIELSPGRESKSVTVINRGDRPIQIGSHYHFFETNPALEFDRRVSFGTHLDIPSGTAVRFEPGESRSVNLVAFGGSQVIEGFNNLTDGRVATELDQATTRAVDGGYGGAG
ncbi:unannotated protein [freshwater metagenome]|uniref:urease n=1 Tax=freshwater metagenome TaxID=449393 RepID=A0A6J5ZMZ9_9ZZZZ|nr:urease subunit beta [Actinomycetota bacterium]